MLVKKLNMQVMGGEMLAVVGANGAGKTTLLRLLCSELEPEEGEIMLYGKPLGAYRPEELSRKRAVLSQHNTISLSFAVDELVLMGRYPRSEEHTSALQSLMRISYSVFCLKKTKTNNTTRH